MHPLEELATAAFVRPPSMPLACKEISSLWPRQVTTGQTTIQPRSIQHPTILPISFLLPAPHRLARSHRFLTVAYLMSILPHLGHRLHPHIHRQRSQVAIQRCPGHRWQPQWLLQLRHFYTKTVRSGDLPTSSKHCLQLLLHLLDSQPKWHLAAC